MTKLILALAGAAVAAGGPAASPAQGQRYMTRTVCTRWHNHRCIEWRHLRVRQIRRRAAAYRMGYVFGPAFGYTAYSALPHPYVVRYRLSPDYRYVYTGGYIYVVNPTTFAVTRIIRAF